MAIEQITARPWELDDLERVAKFRKGIPGETSDIWTEKPNLDACWRGDYREWHIEDGKNYQQQLRCGFWEDFINPSGFSCEVCKVREVLNWQCSHMQDAFADLIATKGKEYASHVLVKAVEKRQLTEKTALELVDEFSLESA